MHCAKLVLQSYKELFIWNGSTSINPNDDSIKKYFTNYIWFSLGALTTKRIFYLTVYSIYQLTHAVLEKVLAYLEYWGLSQRKGESKHEESVS